MGKNITQYWSTEKNEDLKNKIMKLGASKSLSSDEVLYLLTVLYDLDNRTEGIVVSKELPKVTTVLYENKDDDVYPPYLDCPKKNKDVYDD